MADQFNRYRCAHCDWEATVGHVVKHYSKAHPKQISAETVNGKKIAVFQICPTEMGTPKPAGKVYACLACRKFWKNEKTMGAHFVKCENYAIHERMLQALNEPPRGVGGCPAQPVPQPVIPVAETFTENVIVRHTDEPSTDFWKQKYEKLLEKYVALLEKQ